MVVIFHANGFIINKVPIEFSRLPTDYWLISGLFVDGGRKGVLLFFAISGFILAMPFAKYFWKSGKEVKLKDYFIRRLTRLEPPYVITMVACYFGIIMLKGNEFSSMFARSYAGLLPSLASSLTYTHNIFFPNSLSVNHVSWSLEVEVQFYLVVPLLILILKLPALWRRSLLVFLVVLFTGLQHFFQPTVVTLFSFIQYFLMGFLLVDLYLSGWELRLKPVTSFILGALALVAFLYVDVYSGIFYELAFIPAVFLVCVLALTDSFWKKVFSLRFFTAIGGMCYSIYLLHNIIISIFGNRTTDFNISTSYPVVLLWHLAILLPIVLVFSTCFYLLIEQPCMDREWPRKLWNFIRSIFKTNKNNPNSAEVPEVV